jgi:hypothetical protein
MADDDEIMEPDDLPEDEEAEEEDLEGPEIDVDLEEGDELDDLLVEDDEDVFVEIDEDAVVADEEEDADPAAGPVRKTVPTAEDEDEDEDLLAPDDVEADLDMILKDRMVAAEDEANEDDEEPEDRTEPGDRLQPKRADEQLCPSCFLLVRQNAPICPVGDDDCPLFS